MIALPWGSSGCDGKSSGLVSPRPVVSPGTSPRTGGASEEALGEVGASEEAAEEANVRQPHSEITAATASGEQIIVTGDVGADVDEADVIPGAGQLPALVAIKLFF